MSNLPLIQEISTSSILSAINGKNPATDKVLFSDYTAVENLVRNTSSWVHNVSGITGLIAWNDRVRGGTPSGTRLGGVALTKRHILYAKHAGFQYDNTVYFVTKDNELITRRVVGTKDCPSANSDYGIALLESDLPTSIDIVKVLPKDSYRYFNPTEFTLNATTWTSSISDVLILNTNQAEDAAVRTLSRINFGSLEDSDPNNYGLSDYATFQTGVPSTAPASTFYATVSGGDSGSPVMMLLNNEVVVLGTWETASSGPYISSARNYNDLNRMITDVDTTYAALASGFAASGYTMTDVNLDPFLQQWSGLPLSATSVAIFEDGLSPEYDITWSFTYELSNSAPADELGFCMFLQDADFTFQGGGIGSDLGYSGGLEFVSNANKALSGAVLGIGIDSLGIFALSSTYSNTQSRDGIGAGDRVANSISVRDSNYSYLTSVGTVSAFNLISDGVKTIRARLGNYGSKIQVDYKSQGDIFYTNLLTANITRLPFTPLSRYRPGFTVVKPLSAGNVKGEVIVSNFHVEGKTPTTELSAANFNFEPIVPFLLSSINLSEPEVATPIAEAKQPLPFLGIEPDVGCPVISCGLSATDADTKGDFFPSSTLYSISAFIGDVDLQWNTPNFKLPTRFVYMYENNPVYDTGYVGNSIYNYNGSARSTFITGLLSSYSHGSDIELPLSAIAADGYPFVDSTKVAGSSYFYKDSDSSRITLNVYSPLSSTDWIAFIGCPFYTLSCGTEDSYLCGLTQQHETLRKVVFPEYS